jgi:hypothetical protein
MLGKLKWAGPAMGLLVLAAFAWFNWVFLRSELFLGPMSHLQPQIANVGWYFATGRPVYHAPDSAEIYNLLYGPWLYIITGWFEKLFGAGIFSAKLGGALALGASLVLLYGLLCRKAGHGFALLGTGVFAALLMALDPVETLIRGDVFIVLCVTAAGWAAQSPSKFAPVFFGVLAGISFNLKIHSPVYFLPLLWPAWQAGHRWRGLAAAAAGGAVMAVLPFLIFPNISWENYWLTLRTAGEHGFDPTYFLRDISWFFLLSLPLAALAVLARADNPRATEEALAKMRPGLALLLATFVILLPFASKYGAGPHHLLPLIVIFLLFAADLAPLLQPPAKFRSLPMLSVQAALYSWLAACCLVGFLRSHEDTAWLNDRAPWAQSVNADLDGILAKYGPGSVILMGAGGDLDYINTFFRTRLVFAGMPDGIEPGALMEYVFAGKSPANLPALTAMLNHDYPGKKIAWLVPKGNAPFSMDSFYARYIRGEYQEHAPLFDDNFRKNFAQNFSRVATSQFYDIYSD